MSSDSYERLAKTLDKIPNGYPAVESGAHLRVLEWIFTPEEADLASRMKLKGETVEQLAERLEIPIDSLKERLDIMVEKGQINRAYSRSRGAHIYFLMPFVVGIYEEQLDRMDEEFARLFEAYYQEGVFDKVTAASPAIFRVIPIGKKIETQLEIYPYQQAYQMIENAKAWGVRECICRKQQSLLGNSCNYPSRVCLPFSQRENAFDDDPLTKSITKEEALKLLKEAEDAGLVHNASNVQEGHNYICNCCTCCCAVLRGVKDLANPGSFVKADFIVQIGDELCTGCGTCVERCQFDALSVPEEISVLTPERCIGCGVCTITCPEGALTLVDRPKSERTTPPQNILDWMTQRAMGRGVDPSELL